MRTRGLVPAFLVLVFVACGNPAVPTASTSTTATSVVATTDTTMAVTTSSTTTAETTTTAPSVPLIRVENGVKTEGLDTLSVRVGETVIFDVEADASDEVHVHGYDFHFDVAPGNPARVEFVADSTGIFEVELEGLALHLVDIEVTP